jgi:hypothetical protein
MRHIGSNALPALVAAAFALPAVSLGAAPRRPVPLSHPRPPFGYSHRSVCRAVPPARARCLAEVLTVGGAGSDGAAAPLITPGPLGFGPADLQDAYGVVSEAESAGGTQTVALVDAYDDPTAASDLAKYRSQYGLPACAGGCFSKVNERGESGNYPAESPEWEGEISLDLDAVSAICPNCHILLVEAASSFTFDLAASANEAAALGATQISNSYGGPEFASETSLDADYDHPGVAVTVSSGDGGYGVEYPAASRYVTAVGGTSLTPAPAAPRGWAESAWSGAGSGCSKYEGKPLWQTDSGCATRTVADVSAVADPATGAAVYVDGAWAVYGGTSLASPIVAAYDALMGSAAASPQYSYEHPSSYFDVTSGSNGFCGGSYLCNAVAGYDGPTGLGSPHGAGLHRAPTVGTGSASGVTTSAGTIHGTVNPNGTGAKYHFEYGTSTAYGTSTTSKEAGSGSIAQEYTASLSSLSASTTYHFRIVATNEYGEHVGSDNIFKTGGAGTPVPENTVQPHSVGQPVVGAVLTSSTGSWTGLPSAYGYQWWHCMPSGGGCTEISSATASTYTVQAADLTGTVHATVRAYNGGWSGFAVSDNSIGPIRAPVPANTAAPHVTGAGQVGLTLSVSTGIWSGEPSAYEYQWWRCVLIAGGGCSATAISGAVSSGYTVAPGDAESIVWAAVRARNANGWSSFVVSDNALGPIAAPRGQQAAVPPAITRLAIRPSSFRAARKGASIAVATGARVTFALSRAAYLTLTVERALPGRRAGRSCVAPSARNRRASTCTRHVSVKGSFRDPLRGLAGTGGSASKFSGRLAGRQLAPGSYRLVAVAVGADGARSSAARCTFRILR